jgi:serine/threonine protein kinase
VRPRPSDAVLSVRCGWPCSFPPFYDEDLPALFDSILKASFDFPSPWWDPVSPDAKRIIKDGLLVLDHEKRLTAKQVKEDAWIQNAADNNLIEAQRVRVALTPPGARAPRPVACASSPTPRCMHAPKRRPNRRIATPIAPRPPRVRRIGWGTWVRVVLRPCRWPLTS